MFLYLNMDNNYHQLMYNLNNTLYIYYDQYYLFLNNFCNCHDTDNKNHYLSNNLLVLHYNN